MTLLIRVRKAIPLNFLLKNTTSGAAQDSGFTLPTPATATSDKDGDINFGAITFTAEGTYEITIAEQIPESGGFEL